MAVTYAPQQKNLADQVIPLLMQFQMQTKLQDREMAHRKDLRKTMSAEAIAQIDVAQQRADTQKNLSQSAIKQGTAQTNKLQAETKVLNAEAQKWNTDLGMSLKKAELIDDSLGGLISGYENSLKNTNLETNPEQHKALTTQIQELYMMRDAAVGGAKRQIGMYQDDVNNQMNLAKITALEKAAKSRIPVAATKTPQELDYQLDVLGSLGQRVRSGGLDSSLENLLTQVGSSGAFPTRSDVQKFKVSKKGPNRISDLTNKEIATWLQSEEGKKSMENPRTALHVSLNLFERGREDLIPVETPEEWLIKNPNDPRAPEVRAGLNRRR